MKEIKMEHIINASSLNQLFKGELPVLMLTGDSKLKQVVYKLDKLFTNHKETDEVELFVNGEKKGFLRHKNVLDIMEPTRRGTTKGVNDSGGASLGGGGADDLEFVEFECREDGCTKKKKVIFPEPGQQPKCPDHNKAMERVK